MTKRQAENLFREQLDSFRRYFQLKGVKLVIHERFFTPGCDSYRSIAWADPNDWTVNLVRRVLNFSDDSIIALIRHEIAHLADSFRETEGAEQRADDIAELVFGEKIKYSGPHKIQTIGEGEYPRPKELHS
jgi:hypothetical protein